MKKGETETERTQDDLTNLESTKLGKKHVIVPSALTSEELTLEIIAIVIVHDFFYLLGRGVQGRSVDFIKIGKNG